LLAYLALFSGHAKTQPVRSNDSRWELSPDEALVPPSSELVPFGYETEQARARAQGPVLDAYELAGIDKPHNAPEVKVTRLQLWRGLLKKKSKEQLRGYIRWRECHFRWQERRNENTLAHRKSHLRRIPFRWICQRDCPLCRFGTAAWESWAAIAVVLPLDTWLPFWDWIAEAREEFTEQGTWFPKWDEDDAPWDRTTELRL